MSLEGGVVGYHSNLVGGRFAGFMGILVGGGKVGV